MEDSSYLEITRYLVKNESMNFGFLQKQLNLKWLYPFQKNVSFRGLEIPVRGLKNKTSVLRQKKPLKSKKKREQDEIECIKTEYCYSNSGLGNQILSNITKQKERYIYFKGEKISLKENEVGYLNFKGREFYCPLYFIND